MNGMWLVVVLWACRQVVQEVMQLKAQGLPIPEHLLPTQTADEKSKKSKKDSKAGAEARKK